ncbi:MAG: HupE/UreJ family protein, partial [Myxococcales bacterium]|nr:HupE/UreJ family protein [Myxococcales bacterium]
GYDHVLFLVALLLAAPLYSRRDARAGPGFRGAFVYMLKIVTTFTVSHSITLVLAATGAVTLPSKLVEPVIAASIIAVGIANILRVRAARAAAPASDGEAQPAAPGARKRLALVFAFGLVHGFGFAGVLAEAGLPVKGAVLSLFSFNVGVELGQIAVIGLLFPIIFRLSRPPITLPASLLLMVLLAIFFGALVAFGIEVRAWPAFCAVLLTAALLCLRRWSFEAVVMRGGSAIVIAFGLLWLLERLFDWQLLGGRLG